MSEIELFDTHTHLDAGAFDPDRELVIQRAIATGVTRMVTIGAGYGAESAQRAVALAEAHSEIWATVGIHPHDAQTPIAALDDLRRLAQHPRVVAIGETGLDFFRDWSPADLQEEWFNIQIDLALEVKKPLIIHSRQAGERVIEILQNSGAEEVGGVFHCYAENADFAARLAGINFMVSLPGTITFKKAQELRDIVSAIPLSQIMLETDAPYMAPEPNRGARCESAMILDTAKKLAEIKNISLNEVAAITTDNAMRFYKLTRLG